MLLYTFVAGIAVGYGIKSIPQSKHIDVILVFLYNQAKKAINLSKIAFEYINIQISKLIKYFENKNKEEKNKILNENAEKNE